MAIDPRIQSMIDLAKSQVGYHEGRSKNGHWNNVTKYAPEVPKLAWAQGQPWCAVFVYWLALKSGLAAYYPETASVPVAASWFKQRGRWSEYPAIGAQAIFGHYAHTGFVVDFDDTFVWTVEGNTNTNGSAEGDGVYLKKHRRRDAWVLGYGYPDLPLVSAQPAKDSPPKPTFYTVVRGDTLLAIAKHYAVSVGQICKWNNIPNPNVISVGQRLRVSA